MNIKCGPPRIELVEGPSGVVWHEDRVGGDVDEWIAGLGGVADKDGGLQAALPVDKHVLALVDALNLPQKA